MKKNLSRILTGAIAISAACSMTAFAADTATAPKEETPAVGEQADETKGEEPTAEEPVAEEPKADEEDATEVAPAPVSINVGTVSNENAEAQGYVQVQGRIESITQGDGFTTLEVVNDHGGITANVDSSLFVLNYANHAIVSLADLKVNMTVNVIVPANAPMTMSLPPVTSEVTGVVIMDDTGYVNAGHYDSNLLNKQDLLVLDVAENGIIVDMNGEHGELTVNDIVDQDLLVLYKASTRSVPAQASPDLIMILDGSYVPPVDEEATTDDAEEDAAAEETETAMIALRDAADEAGFTIKWEANDKPVVLEKDGVSIELNVGQDTIKKGEESITLSDAVALEDGKIVIPADAVEYLK